MNHINPNSPDRRAVSRADAWLIPVVPDPARPHLFCIHHAGGAASMFRRWTALLRQHAEVVAVQLPGREHRMTEAPITEWSRAVGEITERIVACGSGPLILLGHSLGGLLAFDVQRALEKRPAPSRRLCGLIVSGHRPPHLRSRAQSEQAAPRRVPRSMLPEPELIELLRRYQGTPHEILRSAELREIFLPLMRADFRLSESYRYDAGSRVRCPLLVLGGDADPIVPHQELTAWSELTDADSAVHVFPGGHFFIQEHFAPICAVIAQFIASQFEGDMRREVHDPEPDPRAQGLSGTARPSAR